MNQYLESNNFALLGNILPRDEAEQMFLYLKDLKERSPDVFKAGELCPNSPSVYNAWPFLELLIDYIPNLNRFMGEPMLPTYSMARIYNGGDDLRMHKDRPACEVSITLHLGGDGVEWPIYFEKPNGVVESVLLEPGQAVAYLGCAANHWRDKYMGTEYGQVFFHYVRARGEHRDNYFDRESKLCQ